MKANELRIGNWVKHNPSGWSYRNDDGVISNYGKFNEDCFQWEDTDWYALSECTLDIDLIEPIPLTEEWLLKFGFDEDGEQFNFKGLSIELIGDDGRWCLYMLDEYHNVESSIALFKHVHQLQNLYFALTGEELTLSE